MKPREVVAQLDRFIVGQQDAKKAVAVALRNRWRRHQMSDELKNEVTHYDIYRLFTHCIITYYTDRYETIIA